MDWCGKGVGSEGAAITPQFQLGLQEKQICKKVQDGRVQLHRLECEGQWEDAAALSRGLQDPLYSRGAGRAGGGKRTGAVQGLKAPSVNGSCRRRAQLPDSRFPVQCPVLQLHSSCNSGVL